MKAWLKQLVAFASFVVSLAVSFHFAYAAYLSPSRSHAEFFYGVLAGIGLLVSFIVPILIEVFLDT
jgi:hypothetical protein